jgi:hypothetical protein
MPTREEAIAFVKDSRLPDLVPAVIADAAAFRRLNLKSDDQSRAETLRAAAQLPADKPFPVRES